jgi:hypothetical protein
MEIDEHISDSSKKQSEDTGQNVCKCISGAVMTARFRSFASNRCCTEKISLLLILSVLCNSQQQSSSVTDGRDPELQRIDDSIQNLRIHHRDLKNLLNTSDALGGFRCPCLEVSFVELGI